MKKTITPEFQAHIDAGFKEFGTTRYNKLRIGIVSKKGHSYTPTETWPAIYGLGYILKETKDEQGNNVYIPDTSELYQLVFLAHGSCVETVYVESTQTWRYKLKDSSMNKPISEIYPYRSIDRIRVYDLENQCAGIKPEFAHGV